MISPQVPSRPPAESSDLEIFAHAFDEEFYSLANPELDRTDASLQHFVSHGLKQGLDANANFSVRWYLFAHPDVAAAGLHPLVHYVRFGRAEGRRFRASLVRVVAERDRSIVRSHFDADFYLAQCGGG